MNSQKIPDLLRLTFSSNLRVEPEETALFENRLQDFMPAQVFDAHAHLYRNTHIAQAYQWEGQCPERDADYEFYHQIQAGWMGSHAPRGGLFFAAPEHNLNVAAANDFVRESLRNQPNSRGLLLIQPNDDPAAIESAVVREGWAGFKVYHVFADRPDGQNACINEYLPEWAWDIAHRHRLAIMLHLVRARSLADDDNNRQINILCRKYPAAKLILAHAARGFCAHHTIDGVQRIAGLENVYFDTSAICEAAPFEAILKTFGPSRLLYGSDFPVSQARGRAVSLGVGFYWIYHWDHASWPLGKPVLVGLESLLALRRACETMDLNDGDIKRIFHGNAYELLEL